jgi:hypothetical protein
MTFSFPVVACPAASEHRAALHIQSALSGFSGLSAF